MKEKSGKLRSQTLNVARLTVQMKNQMWSVFQKYYADISREKFESDLAGKNHIILLLDTGDGTIQGFSTIEVYKREILGKKVLAIYSGDTIIAMNYWGQSALQIAFAMFLGKQFLLNGLRPIHWFLISKGYKTYLLFSRNLLDYYPRYDRPTPQWEAQVIDTLATEKFAADWKADKGILQFAVPAGRLIEGIAPIEQSIMDKHADIRFFAEKNPGHMQGDELCCLGAISIATFQHFFMRVFRKLNGVYLEKLRDVLPLGQRAG